MKFRLAGAVPIVLVSLLLSRCVLAQASPVPKTSFPGESLPSRTVNPTDSAGRLGPGEDPENRLVTPFLKHVVDDQKQFWTSPTRFKTKDLKWILPAAGVTAAFIASDSWFAKQVNPAHQQTSLHISDYGAYSLIGLGGASFLFGHITGND